MHLTAGICAVAAPITAAQVENHRPLVFSDIIACRVILCLDVVAKNTCSGNGSAHCRRQSCHPGELEELASIQMVCCDFLSLVHFL
jgi:hypothetical protein